MQVKCKVKKVVYQKDGQDWKIVEYRAEKDQEIKGYFKAKGNSIPTDTFLLVNLVGDFEPENKKGYAPAFEVESFTTEVERTMGNVLSFLASGVLKGVGSVTAKAIYDKFGTDAIDVINNEPERLLEVKGIGEETLKQIKESFAEKQHIHSLMQYLSQYGIKEKKVDAIYRHYGESALEILREDIYNLCEIKGFGWLTVDEMALKTGHPLNTFQRVKSAAVYCLNEYGKMDGHMCIAPLTLLRLLKKCVNHEKSPHKFLEQELKDHINTLVSCKEFKYSKSHFYLRRAFDDEMLCAKIMAERLAWNRDNPSDFSLLPDTPDCDYLAPLQLDACITAVSNNTTIITGGPGTGKTTTLNIFLSLYKDLNPDNAKIKLCAPTGRAAARMTEVTGVQAATIHSLFHLTSEEDGTRDVEKIIASRENIDVLVIDEVSMISQWLINQVLLRISNETKLVLVGDPDQLPSVQRGNVLQEFLKIKHIPCVKLEQVFRQAEGSSIAENAKKISKGETELFYDNDFVMFQADSPMETSTAIIEIYKNAVAQLGQENVQILSPVRQKHFCSTNVLNPLLQSEFHDPSEEMLEHFEDRFYLGDPVMQNRNKNNLSNGDIGIVTQITTDSVFVTYPFQEAPQEYAAEDLQIIELAHALTVHKSQGSEFPVVIIPVLEAHKMALNRNIIYTGITRGKQRVILVGQPAALFYAIKVYKAEKRLTFLSERIINLFTILGGNVCEKNDKEKTA